MNGRNSTTPHTSLCLSCSSTIPSKLVTTTYHAPCCASPICSRCLTVNPRLKEYVPCLRCGDGVQAAKSRIRTVAGRNGRVEDAVEVRDSIVIQADTQFALGDHSDQSDSEDNDSPTGIDDSNPTDLPPSYTSHLDRSPRSDIPTSMKSRSSSVISQRLDAGAENDAEIVGAETTKDVEEDEEEYVEPMRHMVMKGETIRGLASRYGLDPYDLLKINSLPFEALQSNPHLLQTRRFIFLSRPKPPKGQRESVMEGGGEKWFDQDEEEQRKEERRLKRFQLVTKTHDTAIARAYLAVQEIEDSSSFAQGSGSGEVLFSFGDEEMESDDKRGKKKAGLPPGENGRENRAANKFFEDDDWESRQGRVASSSSAGVTERKRETTGRHVEGRSPPFRTGELIQGAPWLEK